MKSLLNYQPSELVDWLAQVGEPRYRAAEILNWIFKRQANDFGEMSSLPIALRRQLGENFRLFDSKELARSESEGGTIKILLGWSDGATTESVMIPAPNDNPRRTVCISTQVGCDVGCRFCASGIGGSIRDLEIGEVVEQAVVVSRLLAARQERLSHIVFMGMGEPLANYEVTIEAVRRFNAEWGLGIGQRKITLSTVGLPKQIERLADEGLQITLAVSLHAPNDRLRQQLIPWAKGIPLARLLEACRQYRRKTGREVTFEYCLLDGVNDLEEHAFQLGKIARSLRAHVNLLMYNPVDDLPFERPSRNHAIEFLKRLRAAGVTAHLRESRGLANDAACGQLRRSV